MSDNEKQKVLKKLSKVLTNTTIPHKDSILPYCYHCESELFVKNVCVVEDPVKTTSAKLVAICLLRKLELFCINYLYRLHKSDKFELCKLLMLNVYYPKKSQQKATCLFKQHLTGT